MPALRLDEDVILAVLDALSEDHVLFEGYALKGGTALRLAYRAPRASVDIDLSSVVRFPDQPADEGQAALDVFCERLGTALDRVRDRHGLADLYVQSQSVIPKKKDPRAFPAFRITVGYSREADRRRPYSETVGLDVTLNDVVCEAEIVTVGGVDVHVSSLDDIVAEKLRALLQQVVRNRYRPGDVYDLWFLVTRAGRLLDPAHVAAFLAEKSRDKEGLGEVSAARFHDPEVAGRAAVGYAEVAERLPPGEALPPFDVAFNRVLAFVDGLPLGSGG